MTIEVIVTMPSYQNPGQNQLTGQGTGNTVTLRTGRSGHYVTLKLFKVHTSAQG